MSSISRDEVAHIAKLALIEMSEQELDKMATELAVIVDSVQSISEAVAADVPATSHPIPLTNVFREDKVRPGLTKEQALASAPDQEDGQFKVPAIIGGE